MGLGCTFVLTLLFEQLSVGHQIFILGNGRVCRPLAGGRRGQLLLAIGQVVALVRLLMCRSLIGRRLLGYPSICLARRNLTVNLLFNLHLLRASTAGSQTTRLALA